MAAESFNHCQLPFSGCYSDASSFSTGRSDDLHLRLRLRLHPAPLSPSSRSSFCRTCTQLKLISTRREAPIMPPALPTSWQRATCKHLALHRRLSFLPWHASQSSWFSDPLASWLLSPFSFHVCSLALKLFRLYCSIFLCNIRRGSLLETAFQWTRGKNSRRLPGRKPWLSHEYIWK